MTPHVCLSSDVRAGDFILDISISILLFSTHLLPYICPSICVSRYDFVVFCRISPYNDIVKDSVVGDYFNIFKTDYRDGHKTTFDTRDVVHEDGLIGYFVDSFFFFNDFHMGKVPPHSIVRTYICFEM